jgi:hypothetical protein
LPERILTGKKINTLMMVFKRRMYRKVLADFWPKNLPK